VYVCACVHVCVCVDVCAHVHVCDHYTMCMCYFCALAGVACVRIQETRFSFCVRGVCVCVFVSARERACMCVYVSP